MGRNSLWQLQIPFQSFLFIYRKIGDLRLLVITRQKGEENNAYHIFQRMPYFGLLAGVSELSCLF